MLQVARLAPRLLGEAGPRVADFLRSQFNEDGGVRDRDGESDLYYTVFGLEGLTALDTKAPAEKGRQYLLGFGDGDQLDFVHLCCLARAWANLPRGVGPESPVQILKKIERYRTPDGGYAAALEGSSGTAYHSFLALGAYQDLGRDLPHPEGLIHCLKQLGTADGAFSNSASLPIGATPATAAAVAIFRQLDEPIPQGLSDWLLARLHPQGGFLAIPDAPIPDLLSTATALHALTSLQIDLSPCREVCLDFIDSLWSGKGFCGSWTDGTVDPEYTYYGLLSLGHLSL